MINAGRSFSGLERNCVFLNPGNLPEAGSRFVNISGASGLDFEDDARALAPVDWDHDGDLDLWISNRNAPRLRFLRNETPSKETRWITFRLSGDGSDCNRDAIGARVELHSSNIPALRSIRTLRAGEGFLSQGSKWIHFGLGIKGRPEKVTVHWPDRARTVEEFDGLSENHRYLLVKGSGKAVVQPARDESLQLVPSPPKPLPPDRTARIPLATLFPKPSLSLNDYSGRPVRIGSGKPLLLNLWATWCAPCLSELEEFTSHAQEIRDAGLEVVALSVDSLGEQQGNPRATLAKMRWPFPAAEATGQTISVLQDYHNALIALNRPLPLPVSFLFDEEGRLSVIYKGPTTPKVVLQDLNHSSGSLEQRWIRAAPLAGTSLQDEIIRKRALTIESIVHFRNGRAREQARDLSGALYHYEAALSHRPDFAEGHKRMGNLQLQRKNLRAALEHYQQAATTEPDDPSTQFALGDTYRLLREPDQAALAYREVLRINPTHLNTQVRLADVLYEGGHLDEAIATARQALAQATEQNNQPIVRILEERIRSYQP